jgi:Arc/MetJ-type ribon-helix-helix transcriptional regulator
MPIRHPKNKTISFRLSDHEYTLAEQICREQEFQSMSDFARCAVLAYSEPAPGSGDAVELDSMKRRVEAVMKQIAELTKRVERE